MISLKRFDFMLKVLWIALIACSVSATLQAAEQTHTFKKIHLEAQSQFDVFITSDKNFAQAAKSPFVQLGRCYSGCSFESHRRLRAEMPATPENAPVSEEGTRNNNLATKVTKVLRIEFRAGELTPRYGTFVTRWQQTRGSDVVVRSQTKNNTVV